jgi:hypothetical protein
MKILFSKAGEFDGDLTYDPRRKRVQGLVQVTDLTLDTGTLKTSVRIGGTVSISDLNLDRGFSHPLSGKIVGVADVTLVDSKAPLKFPVSGRLELEDQGQKLLVPFLGLFHPTTYFKNAWESLLDPTWEGDRDF